jgi:trans-aconitate 2-methyltransferase
VPWDVTSYLDFGDQRLRPAVDLIARIPLREPATVLDLGCGPGGVTRLLRERWPQAEISGIDSSAAMLEKARELLPDVRWIDADLAEFAPAAGCDLVFSNAALHWLPQHDRLFARICSWLRPGGVLAVQMPDNFAAPSHRLIRELAARAEFAACLDGVRMGAVESPARYAEILGRAGGQVDLWCSEYLHLLQGERPVLDWLRGTTLVPYLDRLGPAAGRFLDALGPELIRAYPRGPDGATLFPFRRLFLVARF